MDNPLLLLMLLNGGKLNLNTLILFMLLKGNLGSTLQTLSNPLSVGTFNLGNALGSASKSLFNFGGKASSVFGQPAPKPVAQQLPFLGQASKILAGNTQNIGGVEVTAYDPNPSGSYDPYQGLDPNKYYTD